MTKLDTPGPTPWPRMSDITQPNLLRVEVLRPSEMSIEDWDSVQLYLGVGDGGHVIVTDNAREGALGRVVNASRDGDVLEVHIMLTHYGELHRLRISDGLRPSFVRTSPKTLTLSELKPVTAPSRGH